MSNDNKNAKSPVVDSVVVKTSDTRESQDILSATAKPSNDEQLDSFAELKKATDIVDADGNPVTNQEQSEQAQKKAKIKADLLSEAKQESEMDELDVTESTTKKTDATKDKAAKQPPYFIIGNDAYITSYLNSLSSISSAPPIFMENLLSLKFEEVMLYLLQKYGRKFETYLYSLVGSDYSTFKNMIETTVQSNLKLEEIAFLCNMSLSTFKRHFINEYKVSPGKWFQEKRLQTAKELLQNGSKASNVYTDLGYNNLSNFSQAFKNKFGISPSDVK